MEEPALSLMACSRSQRCWRALPESCSVGSCAGRRTGSARGRGIRLLSEKRGGPAVHQDGSHALGGPCLLLYQLHVGEQVAGGLEDAVVGPGGEP